MTGMIAHDLKTPLSVIMNSKGDKTNREMAGRMLRLVNNMLDVTRFENADLELRLEEVSVKHILDSALSQVRHLLKDKNLSLEENVLDNNVNVDKDILIRVFVNLLTNAVKYAPLNGKIGVKIEREGERLLCSVQDEGVGIPKDKINAIFDSFSQVAPKDSGGIGSTGLGLTFVKLALEAHDSQIQVDSEEGKGSTFSFYLKSGLSGNVVLSETKESEQLVLNEEERQYIQKNLKGLVSLGIHQIGELEKELATMSSTEGSIQLWSQELLNAAYSGNQELFDRLVDQAQLS